MHTIEACFLRLSECPVTSLFGQIGAYVLWDSQAKARPSYIGEGVILKRLAMEHLDRFALPLNGYAAALSGSSQQAKADAEIVETLLLRVAEDTDRMPAINVAPGKTHGIGALFRSHGTIRVNINGYDPLTHPSTARPLTQTKHITVRSDGKGGGAIDHEWRFRRRMTSFS